MGEIWDMREPGEAFCAVCPDHEGCMTGYPCSLVRRLHGVPAPQHTDHGDAARALHETEESGK